MCEQKLMYPRFTWERVHIKTWKYAKGSGEKIGGCTRANSITAGHHIASGLRWPMLAN